ncbi:hypothetical protein [[Clostridium] dakarense]|uniref:hypothetical protein n=1 Tax=Faecalimicrobium dakarense TaxID=1301100 RepID=UPI0012B5FC4D|nr:hypothetical protein [[Clostridium] dakarense]
MIITIISFLIKGGNINYIMIYFMTIILGYLLLKSAYLKYTDVLTLLKINTLAVIFVSIFVIVEFILNTKFNINIREVLLFGNIEEALYLSKFYRSYGFSTEPTNLAYYMNALAPLAICYILKYSKLKKINKLILILIILLAGITTFSAAGFGCLLISLIVLLFINMIKDKKVKLTIKSILFITFIIILSILMIYVFMSTEIDLIKYIDPILNKLSLVGQINSDGSRINLWYRDLKEVQYNILLGSGPGSTSIKYGVSSVNWYLNVLSEEGILALICIIMFMYLTFTRILKSKSTNKNYFLMGFVSSAIYLFTFTAFYDPAIWILLIIFTVDDVGA